METFDLCPEATRLCLKCPSSTIFSKETFHEATRDDYRLKLGNFYANSRPAEFAGSATGAVRHLGCHREWCAGTAHKCRINRQRRAKHPESHVVCCGRSARRPLFSHTE